ncbi:carboxylic ester hydrolase [Elysia marginata]|uniref:Carboxylic ester hydrolase n=1 Tax=Elysia marginata TaxID=1093978 RepID=A0AAV4IVS2_9GAST|nr:carboxylic ester hydrolase [Elysia marginata]
MGGFLRFVFLLLVVVVALSTAANNNRGNRRRWTTTLSTTHGRVTGLRKRVVGVRVDVFYSIPFAKPPVGDLRFKAPEPADPWGSEPIDGTVKPNACWQTIDQAFDRFSGVEMWNPNTPRSEDCLYLNVWRPSPRRNSQPKPIMVWIFGGGFWAGSSVLDVYDGSQLAARRDVIVVTMNYRLGPLGFMYLQNNAEVPGNAGLFDQLLALQWVKENAAYLGGSPDDITIFGESAGAASVGFHMLSPLSRDLFNNAIMESSAPTSYWAVLDTEKTVERVARLAANVSCPVTLGDQLLPCLRAVDPEVLTNQQWILVDKWFDVPIGPIVDGLFLPAHPADMLKDGNIKKTNVIIGVDKNEGIYWDIYGFMNDFPMEKNGNLSRVQFRSIMQVLSDNDREFKRQLIELYNRELRGPMRRMAIVDAASGDSLFKCSVVDFARDYTAVGGNVYLFSFEENFSSDPWPDWMGVPHGFEIEVIFGLPLEEGSGNTSQEKALTRMMMAMWTKFARTGSPASRRVTWPKYTAENNEYVVIDKNGVRTEEGLRKEACELWATRNLGGHSS